MFKKTGALGLQRQTVEFKREIKILIPALRSGTKILLERAKGFVRVAQRVNRCSAHTSCPPESPNSKQLEGPA